MNILKKSHANSTVYFVVGLLILVIAFIQQPTLRSWLGIGNTKMWNDLVQTVNSGSQSVAQDVWMFREFYSRGRIYLQKQQQFPIPEELSSTVSLPESFSPYLLFRSPKLVSIEGSFIQTDSLFFSEKYLKSLGWEMVAQSSSTQIVTSKDKTVALIISVFDIQEASTANGYLYFDLRDNTFAQAMNQKKWLTISLVSLQ
ncbi:MAG: hypothetical protein BroJett025_05130 [Patescibacteria group bacterium]|nr:MAG: hypothetical protein BroJett025_05130 [Patescibacteria group bacterium]